ncbi:MAG: type-F conjugative transfer system pilin assembly protein TrbC [Candidatus Puniceispirillales bacterium WSBS_2018_MAG_OTU23]
MKNILILILLGFFINPVLAADDAINAAEAAAAAVAKTATENIKKWEDDIKTLRDLQAKFEDLNTLLPDELQTETPSLPLENRGINNQLIVFLTLGMPDQSIKDWLYETQAAGGVVVIRGFYGGKLSTTLARLQEIGGLDQDLLGGVQIDPTAFRRLNITAVPMVVVVKDPLPACQNAGCVGDAIPASDRIGGNITLEYALDRLAREGDIAAEIADQHLGQLRNSGGQS